MTQQLLLKQPIATLWNLEIFKFDNIFSLNHFETQSSEPKSFAQYYEIWELHIRWGNIYQQVLETSLLGNG